MTRVRSATPSWTPPRSTPSVATQHGARRDQPARQARDICPRPGGARRLRLRADLLAGGRRYLPGHGSRLLSRPGRASEPRPVEGDVGDSRTAARRRSAATSMAATTAAISGSPTTPAAIATARSVRPPPRKPGSPSARPTCCRSAISTSSSRCRPRSPTSPGRTRRSSTICFSAPPPRR